jgi:MFS family permease
VPTYISEVAPTALRGTLGSLNQLMICFGILAALVVNVLLPMAGWRTMFALGVVPALVLGLGMLSAAESPAWLVRQGRRAEAAQGAEKLWGADGGGLCVHAYAHMCSHVPAKVPGPLLLLLLLLAPCAPSSSPHPPTHTRRSLPAGGRWAW